MADVDITPPPAPPAPTAPPADAPPAPPAPNPVPAPAPPADDLPPSLIHDPSKTPEAKPSEAKPGEEAKPPIVVPEKYDFSALKLPEGIAVDSAIVDAITPVLKEMGVTQEAANKLVSAHAEAVSKLQVQAEAKADADFKQWMTDQARENDKAIRKEWGAEYEQNFKVAQRGLARFFQDPGFYKALDETGLVRSPAFMKGLLQIGKMVQEDQPPNNGNAGGRKSDAEIFYGAPH